MLIAQITDLHVRLPGQKAYRVVDADAHVPAAIDALNRLAPRPDLVLITGDLTDFGRHAEYAHLRTLLAPLRIPYLVLPGNHDDREALREAFPDQACLQHTGPFLQYAVESWPLRLLALDTVTPRHSHGELCNVRLDWLQDRLAEQPGRPTLILMHHPPFDTGIAHMDAIGLRQGRERLEAIVRAHPNVERLLCGHLHRHIVRRFGGTIASTCPGPAHQVALDLRPDGPSAFVMEPPGFLLHQWRDGALITHAGVFGDHGPAHPFHEAGRLIDE